MVQKCHLQRVHFHQRAFRHPSMEEVFDLQDLPSKGSSVEWPSNLNQKMELSRSLASWVLGLKKFLANGTKRTNEQSPALRMLSATEQRQLREWQLHVSSGQLAETDQDVEFNTPSPTL